MVIWLIGLSGSGKTTIGRAVYSLWKPAAPSTVLIDGDEIRRIFGQSSGPSNYTIEGRRINADRIFELCVWLDRQDINVVCCVLSIFPELQQRCRETFSRYVEIFVDVPVSILAERDDKGLYKPALEGRTKNVVAIDIPFPAPRMPNLVIDNSRFDIPPQKLAQDVLRVAGLGNGALS